jgi:hypothetical protein
MTNNVEVRTGKLLALDPGETTGYAVVELRPMLSHTDLPRIFCSGTLSLWRGVEKLILEYAPAMIVYEKFLLYPWKAQQQSYSAMSAAQVVGAIQEIAERYEVPTLGQSAAIGRSVQLPAETKGVIRNRHAIDAYCHSVAYLRSLN